MLESTRPPVLEVMDAPHTEIRDQLVGWAPADVDIRVIARRNDGHWEAVFPEFSIAGQGDTLEQAIENARELLHDYLWLCKNDGLTFAESYRGMGWRSSIGGIADVLRAIVRARRPERVDTRRPLQLA